MANGETKSGQGGRYVTRERNGQYAEGLDRVCRKCGATKGRHDAERPWAQGDLSVGPECDGFKAVRKGELR